MNENTTSGELIFGRFAYACLLIPNGTRSDINDGQREEYREFVIHLLPNNPDENTLFRFRCLTRKMFQNPTVEFATGVGMFGSDYINQSWDPTFVRRYWYYFHVPWNSPGIGDTFNPCATHIVREVKILNVQGYVHGVYTGTVDGTPQIMIDVYGLKPEGDAQVVIHQGVICDIFDETVNNSHQAVGIMADGSDVAPGYETAPVGIGGRLRLVTAIDNSGPGEVGVPGFVSPQLVQAGCDCGHECRGGHCCPRAPHHVQFRDTSDEVVSPGRIVGGVSVVDNAVCATPPAEDAGQLRLLVEEDYLSSPSPVEAGVKSKPV